MKTIYSTAIGLLMPLLVVSINKTTPLGFIENKGQIHDQNFNSRPDVKFLLCSPGVNFQLKTNSFSYDTYTIEQKRSDIKRVNKFSEKSLPDFQNIYTFHRIDVEFINANPNPEIIKESPSENYINCYTNGINKNGITNIKTFQKVTYKNLYPNIDLEFLSTKGKVKYNFILHYGADINQIHWKYKGSDNTLLKNKNIEIEIQKGLFTETIPESYFQFASKKSKSVNISFTNNSDNVFGFKSNQRINLTPDQILVIDPAPNIVWSTYKGGSGDEVLTSTISDVTGNIFVTGWSSSPNSIATSGAHQITYGGGSFDAVIFKFDNSGVLKWGTYYGGNGDDMGSIIVIDKLSNLFVCGPTTSTASISTPSVHQVSYGGGTSDGYLAKFDTNGVRQWCTYYGGTSYDDFYGCSLDKNGNIYLSGTTSSTNAISTGGAYQVAFAGGPYDGYLVKFDNNGVRQWATYYGASGEDQGVSCSTDIKENIYLAGITNSTLSISTLGSNQPNYGGGTYDGYVIKFNKNGVRQWGTYYGGNMEDVIQYIYYDTLDLSRGLYFTGYSTGTNNIASASAYQTINNGGDDAILVRFDTTGARLWGTFLGGLSNDIGDCITSDNSNVYLVGLTQSYSSISTSNGLQTSNGGGGGDGFITKFTKAGIIQWCTYYGGSGYDLCYGSTMDKFGNLFVVGTTNSTGMSTTSAHQTIYGGGPHDGYITKFNQLTPTIVENFSSSNYALNIFPNPNNGTFNINSNEDITLNIINELGQIVRTVKLDTANNHTSSISNLATGVYCIVDKQTGKAIQNKVVVVK